MKDGEKIRYLRKKAGLSQKSLAWFLSITVLELRKMENGEKEFTVDQIENTLNLLFVRKADFAREDLDNVYVANLSPGIYSDDLKDIAEVHKIALNLVEMQLANVL